MGGLGGAGADQGADQDADQGPDQDADQDADQDDQSTKACSGGARRANGHAFVIDHPDRPPDRYPDRHPDRDPDRHPDRHPDRPQPPKRAKTHTRFQPSQ